MKNQKTKIIVKNTGARGVYVQVYDKYDVFFMGSPLTVKLPKQPLSIIYPDKEDLEARHKKWQTRCEEKIERYLRTTFNHTLYGDVTVIFEGFDLDKGDGDE